MTRLFPVLVVATFLLPGAAAAQSLSVETHDGQVSIEARDVPVRAILERWAEASGAALVNADKLQQAARVTLSLAGVPEREAIKTLLRGVGNYIVMTRPQPDESGSTIDRLFIVSSATAAQTMPAARAAAPVAVPAVAAALGSVPRLNAAPGDAGAPPADNDVAAGNDAGAGSAARASPVGGFIGAAVAASAPPFGEPQVPPGYENRLLNQWDENGRQLVGPTPDIPPPPPPPNDPFAERFGTTRPGEIRDSR